MAFLGASTTPKEPKPGHKRHPLSSISRTRTLMKTPVQLTWWGPSRWTVEVDPANDHEFDNGEEDGSEEDSEEDGPEEDSEEEGGA